MARRRYELSASGFDDTLVGMSSDPWSQNRPQGAGLRIPAVLPGDTGPLGRPRYLFCLATRKILNPCKLIGIRQGVTIGNLFLTGGGELPIRAYPLEFFVTTPTFRFVDGNISWHLVYEDNAYPEPHELTVTDTNNWAFNVSDGPAMLYRTFANAAVGPNGEPVDYATNLTAYTPPQLQNSWKPVANDLKCFYDLHFPYKSDHAWEAFGKDGINLEVGRRISLYASVLQTNPATRPPGPSPIGAVGPPSSLQAPNGLPPEEAFICLATNVLLTGGVAYWRILGSLIFDDEIEDVAGRG